MSGRKVPTRVKVVIGAFDRILANIRPAIAFTDGNRVDLGHRVPKEPIDSPFVVRVDI